MLKFSALEIYNEAVRDLLSSDITPLRVLDDPEVNIMTLLFLEKFHPPAIFSEICKN